MMFRRASLVLLSLAAWALTACGHQVTPPFASESLSGYMVVKFRVNSPFDFTNFNYVMVFDTNCASSDPVLCTPHANVYTTTFTNYTYAFVVGTQGGAGALSPLLYQF